MLIVFNPPLLIAEILNFKALRKSNLFSKSNGNRKRIIKALIPNNNALLKFTFLRDLFEDKNKKYPVHCRKKGIPCSVLDKSDPQ